jgi:hypothetical protein
MGNEVNLTNEEMSAMLVSQMLMKSQSGASEETSAEQERQAEIDDMMAALDGLTIEDLAEKKKTKKGGRRKKKAETPKASIYIPEMPEFASLNRDVKMNVTFKQYDIPYKEQLWGIDSRMVTYMLEVVKMPKVAKDISDIMNHNSAYERALAAEGAVRYIKVVTYEVVPYRARELAFVRVASNPQGKLTTKTYVNKNVLKENNVDVDLFEKRLKKAVKQLQN